MRSLFLLFAISLLSAAGCGSSIASRNDGSGASSGSGGAGASSGAGAGGGSSSTGGSSSSSSTSAGGSGGCSGYLDVAADNGAPHHYASICQGSWGSNENTTAVGYHFAGGPQPGVDRFAIDGCLGPGANSEGVSLAIDDASSPGTYTSGAMSYVDPNGTAWGFAGDPLKVTLTKLEPVGGAVEGSFTAVVTHGGNAAHSLDGTFHVCRVSDELVP